MKRFCHVDPKKVLAYFYFDHMDQQKQDVTNLLSSIIAQLSRGISTIPLSVRMLLALHRANLRQPSVNELIATLLSVLRDCGPCYIIIDALDECAERVSLLDTLSQLAGAGEEKLHILMTTRHEPGINEELPIATEMVAIRYSMVNEDIRLFVQNRLCQDSRLSRWPDSLKSVIETSLVEGAHGM